jgi:hypothetical protein
VKLAEWGEAGKGDGKFQLITGIAAGGMNVFAADAANRHILRFDVNGDYIATIGKRDREAGDAGLVVPSPHLDVAVDGEELINANPGRRRVEFRNVNGELKRFWGEPGNRPEAFCGCCNPVNIAAMPDGNIVTAEKGIVRVKLYDREGRMLAYMGPEYFDPQSDGLDVAADSAGRILVLDPKARKVLVFTRREEQQ